MTPGARQYPLNTHWRVSRRLLGEQSEPLLVIDGAMERPADLVDAATAVRFAPAYGAGGGYPGLRAPAPRVYVETLSQVLLPLIVRAFELPPCRIARADCAFSLVTLPPDALHPRQTIPHVDGTDQLQFAVLHYLCDPHFGGTAFYRHRATGFETLTAERVAEYEAARERDGPATGYIAGPTPAYDCIGAVDAAFDRIAVYRSCLLHSGRIDAPQALTDDPRTGRLTANIFLILRPA